MRLRSGRHIVRRKNIYLPTEVWVEVFCYPWISRKQLAQIVDRIGNRWFAEKLQFYLHEWGRHTLGHLYIANLGVNGSNEFPQTAMPEKITTFKSIRIDHFDNHVFNFFRHIQGLLTADTKLDICCINPWHIAHQLDNARTILGHLLPLIDGVHTLYTDDRMLPQMKSALGEKFHKIKMLDVKFTNFMQSAVEPTMEWLTTSNHNNNHNEPKLLEPKLLQLCCVWHETAQQVLEAIRKQFLKATQPSTFAVIFRCTHKFHNFNSANGIGEQLYGIRIVNKDDDDFGKFKVFRHQAIAEAGDQLRQWLDDGSGYKEGMYHRKQYIQFVKPGIGSGNILALPDLEEADENEKPSASKKRRICK